MHGFRSPEERAQWEAMCRPAARALDVLEERPIDNGTINALMRLRGAPMRDNDAFRAAALWTRCEAWLSAQKMVAQAECASCLGGNRDLVAQELALWSHVNYGSMLNDLDLVDQVVESLGSTWAALERGDITPAHLKAMAKETRRCTPRVAAHVERVLIPLAIEKEWTPGELAAAARKAVIEADPDGAQDQAREAKKRSDVTLFGEPCEMATLTAYGSGVTLTQLLARIDARARQLKAAGDARTIGELRIEAMREAILGGDTSSWPMVRTDLTLDVETFLGLNRKPGELVGYGPITAETARELAEDSQMRRLLTDPLEGVVVDVGRRHYRPTKRQHDIVNTVHKTCSMPGCCKPAIHCDRDHRFSWGEGGATSTCNLHPLCRRHHNLKTKRYWRIDQMPDGTEVWTSPLGRQFTKRHPTYPDGLIQPLDDEDDLPEDVAYRLPEADPDPPRDADGIPYPTEPPPLTAEELEEFEQALDIYRAFGAAFINNANQHYDEARALGLIA